MESRICCTVEIFPTNSFDDQHRQWADDANHNFPIYKKKKTENVEKKADWNVVMHKFKQTLVYIERKNSAYFYLFTRFQRWADPLYSNKQTNINWNLVQVQTGLV